MANPREMFEFSIFLGVFYFLYTVIVIRGETIEGSGLELFTGLARAFFVPFKGLEHGWEFLNLLIFFPIYVFLLFTAIDMAEKSVVGSHAILVLLGILFAGSFIAIILPEGSTIEGFREGIKDFFMIEVKQWIIDGFYALGGALKAGILGIGSGIVEGAKQIPSKVKDFFGGLF